MEEVQKCIDDFTDNHIKDLLKNLRGSYGLKKYTRLACLPLKRRKIISEIVVTVFRGILGLFRHILGHF